MEILKRLAGLISSEPGRPHPLDGGDSGLPAPGTIRQLPTPDPVHPRVLAIIHNPIIPMKGGLKAQHAYGWNDPDALAQGYIDDIAAISGGYAQFRIVERIEVDEFPLKKDGYRYTPADFHRAWTTRQPHAPDDVDYLALVRQFKLIERINDDQIDEVWLLGFPYCGYYESIMAGPGAFWCNAPPLLGTERAKKRFVIMGFNYERGVGEMLEDLGHRAESILSKVFANTRGEANLWERFIRYDKTHPGMAECGNVHFAPNSLKDYDWGNPRPVLSRCDTWYRFPDLSGEPRTVTASEWGSGEIRAHHRWWFRHFPQVVGASGGISWNWWEYVIDPNRV
ncbi:MAG: hypothetical protein U0670_03300 [Anaerolineae bacterium]